MRSAFDTNVLAYAEGLRLVDADDAKVIVASLLIGSILVEGAMVLSAQVQAELHHLLRKKAGYSATVSAEIVAEYANFATTIPTDLAVLTEAFELAEKHDLQTYDAIILAAATQGGCDVLYSEDMQDGFEWRGVKVVNPFT